MPDTQTEAEGSAGLHPRIIVSRNGPYYVSGTVPLAEQSVECDANGDPCAWRAERRLPGEEEYALCRCGHSGDKPFCDGSHRHTDFDGTETAPLTIDPAHVQRTTGPTLDLDDAEELCAGAGFCHPAGGTWELVERSDDAAARRAAIQQAADCPSGRLVAREKGGRAIEPPFAPAIRVTGDSRSGPLGPLWVRGGIPIESANGKTYAVRNRVTLCRCGQSANKPLCDGSHSD